MWCSNKNCIEKRVREEEEEEEKVKKKTPTNIFFMCDFKLSFNNSFNEWHFYVTSILTYAHFLDFYVIIEIFVDRLAPLKFSFSCLVF